MRGRGIARWEEEYKLPLFHTSIAHLNNRPVFATFPTSIALRLFLLMISFFVILKGVYILDTRWAENYKLGLFHASIAPSDRTLIPTFRFFRDHSDIQVLLITF